jgi:hypothetical protein
VAGTKHKLLVSFAGLAAVVRGNHLWFASGAFEPDTVIYQGPG